MFPFSSFPAFQGLGRARSPSLQGCFDFWRRKRSLSFTSREFLWRSCVLTSLATPSPHPQSMCFLHCSGSPKHNLGVTLHFPQNCVPCRSWFSWRSQVTSLPHFLLVPLPLPRMLSSTFSQCISFCPHWFKPAGFWPAHLPLEAQFPPHSVLHILPLASCSSFYARFSISLTQCLPRGLP